MQPGQEGDVDTTQIVTFDENARKITGILQILGPQPLEDGEVLDFLQCKDIRTPAVINLQDGLGDDTQLVVEDRLAPVPVEALFTPAIDSDEVALGDVRLALLGGKRQEGLIVLARIISSVEQVFDVERHDADDLLSNFFHRRLVSRLTARQGAACEQASDQQ